MVAMVINDYDDMDPDLIVKTYHGDFHGVGVKAFNDALAELGRQK